MFQRIESTALALLARREYSAKELQTKLIQRGFPMDFIHEIIQKCKEDGSLSDTRFAEILVRRRINQGYGPLKIEQELLEKGVSDEIIAPFLHENYDWIARIGEVKRKKFGKAIPKDYLERGKQIRFLQYRGFALEEILKFFEL